MPQSINHFTLTLALLKAELSMNAMILAFHKAGFNIERRVYDLSMQIMELVGFSEDECHNDSELMDFYVSKMDAIIEENLLGKSDSINEVALLFYAELLAEKKHRQQNQAQP